MAGKFGTPHVLQREMPHHPKISKEYLFGSKTPIQYQNKEKKKDPNVPLLFLTRRQQREDNDKSLNGTDLHRSSVHPSLVKKKHDERRAIMENFFFDHWEMEEMDNHEDNEEIEETTGANTLSSVLSAGNLVAEWFGMMDLDPSSNGFVAKAKKIRFAQTVAVILIPSRTEYLKAGLCLWYFHHFCMIDLGHSIS